MIFKPPPGDPEERLPGRPARKPAGITARVEAAAKHRAPAPKGKGVVMILLGVAVLAALIWDFTGRGSAGRAIRESVDDGERPVPKEGPAKPDEPGPPATPPPPDPTLIDVVVKEGAILSMSPLDAAAFVASAPEADRADLRSRVLKALVAPAGAKGGRASAALEAAAWLAKDAGEQSAAVIARLTLKAYPALEDDRTAYAAILFLANVPDRGGAAGAAALDDVILGRKRPLHLRIAAARIRPAAGRPDAVTALATDPATHPALREALGK